ncbi:hypothetical protein DAPPUDRAFT_254479 [Daphnia pulex]|uniref:Uncharacterized protein n=1 Tax=Daphnia pulex TaxID=6669 RepID=E9H761_DAPPU|nr:hypothetical protein DAPPUDRAFT_254479 [Daphnia pulex]|eukprot:EFX72321.1 hypothetical protein DAPPUDRAFT_254479 [Daphnia pulex]
MAQILKLLLNDALAISTEAELVLDANRLMAIAPITRPRPDLICNCKDSQQHGARRKLARNKKKHAKKPQVAAVTASDVLDASKRIQPPGDDIADEHPNNDLVYEDFARIEPMCDLGIANFRQFLSKRKNGGHTF